MYDVLLKIKLITCILTNKRLFRMYKLNVTHYSIAQGAIENKSIKEFATIEEVAHIIQERVNLYFDQSHPLYGMHTRSPKEVIVCTDVADRNGELVEPQKVYGITMHYKKYIDNNMPFRIAVKHYDNLNTRYSSLVIIDVNVDK